MARYAVKEPPEGYLVVRDRKTTRYYPLRYNQGSKMLAAGNGWEYFANGSGGYISYAKRWQAVRFCEGLATTDNASNQ